MIGLKFTDFKVEAGYVLKKPAWNKGYMSEALQAIINIAFSEGIGTINHISGENNVVLDNYILVKTNPTENVYRPHKIGTKAALEAADKLINFLMSKVDIKYNLAAQDFKLGRQDINKSTIQAHGHYKGVSGMNYIYYAWTYGLAYKNGGKNILSKQYGYN